MESRIFPKFAAVISAALGIITVANAQTELMSLAITGRITLVDPLLTSYYSTNNPISVTFYYPTGQPGYTASAYSSAYSSSVSVVTSGHNLSGSGFLSIKNDVPFDEAIFAYLPLSGLQIAPFNTPEIYVGFVDSTSQIFTNTALPNPFPTLSQWDAYSGAFISYEDRTIAGGLSRRVNFTIEGMTVVSEPLTNSPAAFGTLTNGTTAVAAPYSTVAGVSGTATVNVDAAGITITNVSGGTVNVNGASTTIQSYNGGAVAVGAGLSVVMNDGTSSGVISGNGGMTKHSAGVLSLSGINTYSGATTVAAGKLVVDGSINNSTVTVNNGGTLAGSGSVGGIVLNVGSTISPGNSPGTLNIAGNAVWNPGANYNWQIYNTALAAGTGWDLVNVTGALDLSALTVGSTFNINLWSVSSIAPDVNGNALNFDPSQNYTWTILSAAGGIFGFDPSGFTINAGAFNGTSGFQNGLAGGSFSLVSTNNNLNLLFTAAGGPGLGPSGIPEPGTWAAAALLVGGAALVRWRRRSNVS